MIDAQAVHGSRRRGIAVNVRRIAAVATYGVALFVAFQLAAPLLERSPAPTPQPVAEAEAAAPAPERPASVPAHVPTWAWELSAWHDDRIRNIRPFEAPTPLPAWYWEWRAWRIDLAKHAER
jgi:hypothetical protein